MSRAPMMIDWDLAVNTASRLAGPGPAVDRSQAEAVVAELRDGARRSTPLVREFTGLVAPEQTDRQTPVLVVDRPGWIQANANGFAEVIGPLIERLQKQRGNPSPVTEAVGSRVTGLEVGGLLGFMSGKVLGQFDPFYAPHAGNGADLAVGRMLLVAPNIVHVERELHVRPADFRLWVCLHEETHRVQFTAVPWLGDHIRGEIERLVESVDLDPSRVAAVLGEAVKRLGDVVRGRDDASIIDLLATPAQRETMDRLTGVMSLLEGHADVVMDGVGPEVIGTVADIRRKFNLRRKGVGQIDRLLRRLLGLDAKMAQYRDGATFTRAVVERVGMDGFNRVWSSPETLPSKAEILDPASWVDRVHG